MPTDRTGSGPWLEPMAAATSSAMILTDRSGRIEWVNPAFTRTTGWQLSEVAGRTPGDVLQGPDTDPVVVTHMRAALAAGQGFDVELLNYRRDGSTCHFHVQVDPLCDDTGALTGFVGVQHDITARVEAQLAVDAQNQRLALAVAGTGYGVWEFDPRAGHLYWDDQMYALYGHTRESFDGSPEVWQACLHPDDRALVIARFGELIAGKLVDLFEFRAFRHSDGELRYVEANGCCQFDHTGAVRRVLGMNRDITERRRMTEAAQLGEERWKFALEGAGDGVWDWDLGSGEIVLSKRCREILGYLGGGEQRVGTSIDGWLALVHPEDLVGAQVRMESHLAGTSASYVSEHRVLCQDGSYKWVLSRGMVVRRDAVGTQRRIVGTLSDISERRHLEERLRQAQKMEVVGQLAGGVAHDFNNILSAMMLRLETLRFEELPEVVESAVSDLEGMTRRAAVVTRQLLAFARRQNLRTSTVDLTVVVSDLIQMLRRLIGDPWTIRTEIASQPLMVRADSDLLSQAIINICLNARDAMPDGGVLTIAVARVERAGPTPEGETVGRSGVFARISVRDQGHGMDAETRERIFEPFFTTKPVGRGTGLGLASVYGTLQQHGGWVDVESEVGAGSVFHLYLPTADGDEGAAMRGASGRLTQQGNGRTVLLVEDEAEVRQSTERVLRSLGYRVLSATNGVAALHLWDTERAAIDILLTDLTMPGGVDGRQLCARLLAAKPGLRAVVMTGGIPERLAGAAETTGLPTVLHKPFSARELAAALGGERAKGDQPVG